MKKRKFSGDFIMVLVALVSFAAGFGLKHMQSEMVRSTLNICRWDAFDNWVRCTEKIKGKAETLTKNIFKYNEGTELERKQFKGFSEMSFSNQCHSDYNEELDKCIDQGSGRTSLY